MTHPDGTSTERPSGNAALTFRPLTLYTVQWVERLVTEHFGSPRVVARGVLHQVRDLPGLIAVRAGKQVGLMQYHIAYYELEEAELEKAEFEHADLEIVTLIARSRRTGVGRGLLAAAEPIARAAGCRRMWLVTTNNNEGGLALYRALGWRQRAVHLGAVDRARVLKPEIPAADERGRPISDEIEFELMLRQSTERD